MIAAWPDEVFSTTCSPIRESESHDLHSCVAKPPLASCSASAGDSATYNPTRFSSTQLSPSSVTSTVIDGLAWYSDLHAGAPHAGTDAIVAVASRRQLIASATSGFVR